MAAIPPRNAAFALGVGVLLVLLTLATSGAAPKFLLLPEGPTSPPFPTTSPSKPQEVAWSGPMSPTAPYLL